jgi:hypothetical protein
MEYPSSSGDLVAVVALRDCALSRRTRELSIVPRGYERLPTQGNAFRMKYEGFVHPVWISDSVLMVEAEGLSGAWVQRRLVHGVTVAARDISGARLDSLQVAPHQYTKDHLLYSLSLLRERYAGQRDSVAVEAVLSPLSDTTSLTRLVDNRRRFEAWMILDAWGHEPQLRSSAMTATAISAGADSVFGTTDDISVTATR